MNNDLEKLCEETNEKVKQAYLALHDNPYSKERIQVLEEKLTNDIYESEMQIQKLRDLYPELIEEYYRRRTVLKRIADGLAWIILDFNPGHILACSVGYPPGFMAGKRGYVAERYVVKACAKHSDVRWAIQCDITNVLRLGDVIAVKKDGEIQPIEVKGSKSKQATRQRQRAKKVVNFINTGVLDNYIKGLGPLKTYKLPITYDHYWKELESLSKKALASGVAWSVFDDCLAICVTEQSYSSKEIIDDAMQNITINWDKQNLIFRGLGTHMNRDPEILPLKRFPLTLFPIDTSLGIKFVLRELGAIVLLNIDIILEKMKQAGLEVSKDKDGVDVINTPTGVKFSIVHGWEKILLELITVPSFVEFMLLSTQRIDSET